MDTVKVTIEYGNDEVMRLDAKALPSEAQRLRKAVAKMVDTIVNRRRRTADRLRGRAEALDP